MTKSRNSDLIGGTVGLVLAVAFWYSREGNWSYWSAVFPNVMIVIIAALSIMLLIKGFVAPAMLPLFAEGNRTKMALTAILLIAWGFAFSWLGTLASSFIGFAVLTVYLGREQEPFTPKRLLMVALIVVAEIAAFYLIFTRVLHVPLPGGVLF